MIIANAELSLRITREACEKMKKESLDRIENKFNDFLTDLAKRIYDAACKGCSSVKIINKNITDEDWEDIKWYLEMNHYEAWRCISNGISGFVISWERIKGGYNYDD